MTKISLTPVIDVVFILLIFFMLASNFNKVGEVNMDMTKESITSNKEDIKYFKENFESILFNDGFFNIFKKDKLKKFLLAVI